VNIFTVRLSSACFLPFFSFGLFSWCHVQIQLAELVKTSQLSGTQLASTFLKYAIGGTLGTIVIMFITSSPPVLIDYWGNTKHISPVIISVIKTSVSISIAFLSFKIGSRLVTNKK
jgi:uncharacterized membrane protein